MLFVCAFVLLFSLHSYIAIFVLPKVLILDIIIFANLFLGAGLGVKSDDDKYFCRFVRGSIAHILDLIVWVSLQSCNMLGAP